jgi:hypothetical protein
MRRHRTGSRLAYPNIARVPCVAERANEVTQGYVNNSETSTQRASRLVLSARTGRIRFGGEVRTQTVRIPSNF